MRGNPQPAISFRRGHERGGSRTNVTFLQHNVVAVQDFEHISVLPTELHFELRHVFIAELCIYIKQTLHACAECSL